jgi:mono/diheme cytochrome c family protein
VLALLLAAVGAGFAQSPDKSGGAKKQSAAETAGDAAKGRVVYQRNCAICHHTASTAKKIGPGLKSIYRRGKFGSGKPVNDETMRAWIEDGGKDMPQFKDTLNPAQIAHLIAYIKTL